MTIFRLFFQRFNRLLFLIILIIIFRFNCNPDKGFESRQVMASEPSTESESKNVLLLIADNYGRDAGCYGNSVIKTPNIDKLSENGVRFDNAFATVASCSACRSVIYTGLFNHTNGQYGHAHNPYDHDTHDWVKSMPGFLNEKGYHTGLIGKFHVKPRTVYCFDEIIEWGRDGNTLSNEVNGFLTTCDKRPFLLVVAFHDPASWHNHRDKESLKKEIYPGLKPVKYSPDEVIVPAVLPDRPEVREELSLYYRAVSRMDQQVGLVLEALKESGREDGTMIIFIGDGGPAFPGMGYDLYDTSILQPMIISTPNLSRRGIVNHGMVSFIDILPTVLHWAGYEPPFEVKSPGYNRAGALIRFLDLPQTGDSYTLPGRSLLPVLEEENPAGFDTVFASHSFHESTMYYPMRSIRTRKYKYIVNIDNRCEFRLATDIFNCATWQGILKRNSKKLGVRSVHSYIYRPKEELYNIEEDPYETNNLASDSVYGKVLKKLRKRVKEFQIATDDIWLLRWIY